MWIEVYDLCVSTLQSEAISLSTSVFNRGGNDCGEDCGDNFGEDYGEDCSGSLRTVVLLPTLTVRVRMVWRFEAVEFSLHRRNVDNKLRVILCLRHLLNITSFR